MRFIAGAARPEHLPIASVPEVAFAGRSNVGKSSLLNRLLGRRGVARVSRTPGRTQQINFFAVGEQLVLVDLPGYGFARVPRFVQEQWRVLVEHYLAKRRNLCAVVVIVDARRGLGQDDAALLDFLAAHGVESVLVATKVDKLKRSQRAPALGAVGAARAQVPIAFSALTGEGTEELWSALRAALRRRGSGR